MDPVDKISKESKVLIDAAKDALSANLLAASNSKIINLNEDQLTKLINLVDISLNESFQKSLPTFQKSIKQHFLTKSKKDA